MTDAEAVRAEIVERLMAKDNRPLQLCMARSSWAMDHDGIQMFLAEQLASLLYPDKETE